MAVKDYIVEDKKSVLLASEPLYSWGGSWTEDKLDTFEKYVNAYLTIMNKYRDEYRWKLIYFDGFAGSGSRTESSQDADSDLLQEMFNDTILSREELNVYKGAAERVLNIKQRGFDFYYFIDKDEESSKQLEVLLEPFKGDKILKFRTSDANEQVKMLARAMRNDRKLVSLVLLDPFGMQVYWETIEELKNTHTDFWILIPTGVIINRLLDRKGELIYIDKLKSFFGKDEKFLRNYFYSKKQEQTLFGEIEVIEKVNKPIQKIAELYIRRLGEIFKYVTPEPLVLYNSRNIPIFHFACASNNQSAVKIARDIIYKNQR